MSFKLKISSKDRATGRFMSRVHRALAKVVAETKLEKGLTQQQIADAMGVDKSVVSRILNGESNLTLKTIGDITWALGIKPEVTFKSIAVEASRTVNHVAMPAVVAAQSKLSRPETRQSVEMGMTWVHPETKTGSSAQPIKYISMEITNVR